MSYISDALRKARQAKSQEQEQIKKSVWRSLWGASAAEGKKKDTWRKRYTVIGLSITLLYAVCMIGVMYWPDIKPIFISATVSGKPVRVTVEPIPTSKEQKLQPAPAAASQAPPAPVLAGAPPPAATGVDAQKLPAPAAPAGLKEDRKNEALAESEDEPPVKEVTANPKKLYAQALKKQREENLEEAKELYRQVLKAEPGNVKALNNLGVVYMKMKQHKWAIIRLEEAVRIRPRYADAHYNLACLYAQINHPQKSLVYLKNAVALNPEAKKWAAQDGDFKGLANIAEYKDIIQAQDN